MPFPQSPELEFAFTIALRLQPPIFFPTPNLGVRYAAVHLIDGTIKGPDIKGVVEPASGGDWARLRPDGVLELDARYTLRLDDGTVIYMQNQGYRWGPPELMAAQARGEHVEPDHYYMRVTPRFVVEEGPHDWLARHVFVGRGGRTPEGNRIDYFKLG